MTFDPTTVLYEVDQGADRLEKAVDVLTQAIEAYERVEDEYEMAMAVERTKVFHDDSYDRPPAADVRNDLALQAIPQDLRVRFSEAKAKRESLTFRYRALAAAVSARQSLLKAMGDAG